MITTEIEIKDGMVYEHTYEDDVLIQTVLKCAFISLEVTGADVVQVNTPTPITVSYKDYEGNELQTEDSAIKVSVKHDEEVVGELELLPSNGMAVFDFFVEGPGEYWIEASCDKTSNPGGKTVMVNA